MKITFLVGSAFSSHTRTAIDYAKASLEKRFPGHELTLLDLSDFDLQFSDGRNYLDYDGDTGKVAQQLMETEVLIIGTPIFQASIPGALKNVFDFLPVNAFRDKVVGIIAVAGSSKHFLVVEQQLKTILSYMKAQLVQTYVFAEDTDFNKGEMINDDLLFRIDRLIEETVMLSEVYKEIRAAKDEAYDF